MSGQPGTWLQLALFGSLAIAGCLGKPAPLPDELQLEVLEKPHMEIVNLTAQDVGRYPPLKQLIDKWVADGSPHTRHLYRIPSDYKDAQALVDSLRQRIPSVRAGAFDIAIQYNGTAFNVIAAKVFYNR